MILRDSITMMRTQLAAILVALFLLSSVGAEPIPEALRGRTYLFFEGGNERNFSIIGDAPVKTVIRVRFSGEYKMQMHWANLTGTHFNNAYDIAGEVLKQFAMEDHVVNVAGPEHLGPILDNPNAKANWFFNAALETRWSCKEALERLNSLALASGVSYTSYTMSGRIRGKDQTIEKSISSLSGEIVDFDERPECYLERFGESPWNTAYKILAAQESFTDVELIKERSANCTRGLCAVRGILDERNPKHAIYSEETFSEEEARGGSRALPTEQIHSRYNYDDQKATKVINSGGVMVLHLFPQVRWAPRNTLTGKPILNTLFLKSTAEAKALRAAALAPGAGDNPATMGWRTPMVAEDSSAVLSVLLKVDATNPDIRGLLWLQERGVPTPKWSHNPPIAIEVPGQGFPSQSALAGHILSAFAAKKETTLDQFLRINQRCGWDWSTIERDAAYTMYGQTPVEEKWASSRIPYCYSSDDQEKAAWLNGEEKERALRDERPCVLRFDKDGKPTAGAFMTMTKRWKLKTDPTTKRPYDAADFIWQGCPDKKTPFWTLGPVATGDPNEQTISIKVGSRTEYITLPGGRRIEYVVEDFQSFVKDFLNKNRLEEFMRQPYHRCNPTHVLNSCRTYTWIYDMFAQGVVYDGTGQLKRTAERKKNASCQDVNALLVQLTQVASSRPQDLPDFTKCTNIHAFNAATYPTPYVVDYSVYPVKPLFPAR
jgi:hypothetical protein